MQDTHESREGRDMVMGTKERARPIEEMKREDLPPAESPTKVSHFRITVLSIKSADTEYTHQLIKGCKRFKIQCRDGTAIRVATERDVVATPSSDKYWTLQAAIASGAPGRIWEENNLDIQDENMIFYFACASGDKFLEIIEGF